MVTDTLIFGCGGAVHGLFFLLIKLNLFLSLEANSSIVLSCNSQAITTHGSVDRTTNKQQWRVTVVAL